MEELMEQNKDLKSILRLDDPWSLIEIIKKLNEGNEILLHEKSYDGHGWEFLNKAVEEAEKSIIQIETILKKQYGK